MPDSADSFWFCDLAAGLEIEVVDIADARRVALRASEGSVHCDDRHDTGLSAEEKKQGAQHSGAGPHGHLQRTSLSPYLDADCNAGAEGPVVKAGLGRTEDEVEEAMRVVSEKSPKLETLKVETTMHSGGNQFAEQAQLPGDPPYIQPRKRKLALGVLGRRYRCSSSCDAPVGAPEPSLSYRAGIKDDDDGVGLAGCSLQAASNPCNRSRRHRFSSPRGHGNSTQRNAHKHDLFSSKNTDLGGGIIRMQFVAADAEGGQVPRSGDGFR
ncbi:hypothetical protein M407DRAFT_229592 [Tulasnella calospora MUT 4182]|uniref:Uncharacterized protein n=1 Tax=Tulasnella calospora MUT 4182 TaxID=1051891 RepID=A0A0C3LIC2_9AGAM|nr:hypothetical protein M407DRAFT_229592 [Tulasnella calospora MUT 4182]